MAYYAGSGVVGRLHPSLQAYIDCFESPLIGKGWPRGGGLWDQNPILVKHFRLIKKLERELKDSQETIPGAQTSGGDGGPLGSVLDQYVKSLEDEGETTVL